ncbi:MAG: S8 family serine peptidase [Promethearchaeia archaeon]
MNYASFQTGAKNSTWYLNGYTGNTDSSIAVLDSGVNLNHIFLEDKISGWQSFIDDSPISDDFGHGTLISSIIAGTGSDLYNSGTPSVVNLYGNYSHLDLFGSDPIPKNFTIKVFSFNTSKINSKIILNSSWNILKDGIDGFWFELYCDNILVNSSSNVIPTQRNVIIHQVSESGLGVYDLYIKYHKTNKFPIFSFNSSALIFPEFYVKHNNHYTGIANSSKILAYKIVNETGEGYVSDLISALGSIIQNKSKHHIVSTCLSIGTFGDNFGAINKVIDDVINNGIVVIIAAGNKGVSGTQSTLNKLAITNEAIVVGATNDNDQITSYSGIGEQVDIVAPGGSRLKNHRMVISADPKSNSTTSAFGTSISTAIVSAATNILIEAIWGDWSVWEIQDPQERVGIIKSILLMTASETDLQREDDPQTGDVDESQHSPTSFSGLLSSIKDEHEGYGRINLQVAIDALTKYLNVNTSISDYLYSSQENPLAKHAFARRVVLKPNKQYLFNITDKDETGDFDLFLFSNESKGNGEPIILQTSRKWYSNSNSFYFTPKQNQTESIIVVKVINGYGNFTLKVSNVNNSYAPQLEIPEISYFGGSKNTTVMGFQEYSGGYHPKNYSIDSYRFYINYFDNDSANVPPQEVYVSILELSMNYSLSQFNVLDNNYTNGALFISDYLKLPVPMTYHYYFIASDGSHKTRYPELGEFSILIEYPYDYEKFPYLHSFNTGLGSWVSNGTGWGLLNQYNSVDNRVSIYDNWTSMYFGAYHNYPMNYSYQPDLITDPYPNGTLFSPLFDLTQLNENLTTPYAKFGLRTSINSGDLIILQIGLNWTNWITLRIFTDEESEWHIEEFNLTEYIGYFIQFRFISFLDDNFDPVNYKGLMLDCFELTNYINLYAPRIYFNLGYDISSVNGSKFEKFGFSCEYFDRDNSYPEFVYVEMNGANYSMYNVFGHWNTSLNVKFTRSLLLSEINNHTFRFHASDGIFINTTEWYNVNNTLFNFISPIPYQFNLNYSNKLIGFQFSSKIMTDYYVVGTPSPKESTAWFNGDNTWHSIRRLGHYYIYGGIGNSYGSLNQGYGPNWDAKLITYPIYLRGEYNCYLKFEHEIVLQNEYGVSQENLDSCIISVSIDYGENWIILKEYYYDDEKLSGNESIDLSEYRDETVMVMFTINSNDAPIGLGYGWLLSDIYIGYDETTDFISPNVYIISPLNQETISSIYTIRANLSDNVNLDSSRIYIYIDGVLVERQLYSFDRDIGILEYNWDTTYYSDGKHEITVTAFDKEGNREDATISIVVQNGFFNWRTWGPWVVVFLSLIIFGFIIYKIAKKKRRIWKEKIKKISTEKIGLDKIQKMRMVELVKSEEERSRPLILYCKFCKSWFESNKFDYICPICEHDQIYAAYNCVNCNKWYFKDEPAENYYCKSKTCKNIRLFRRKGEEIKDILENEGTILRKFDRKKKKFSILD